MRKRLWKGLMVLLACCTAEQAVAIEICIDGIYYKKNADGLSWYAFEGMGATGHVTIPDSITIEISGDAPGETETLPVTRIAGNCCSWNPNRSCYIESLSIGNNVSIIGANAFSNCRELKSITMGENISFIGAGAFSNTAIESVVIPKGITEINERVFNSCTNLKSAVIHNRVTKIGKQAFYDCDSLSAITLPNSVKEIGYSSFGQGGLKSIVIPNSVTKIDSSAFEFNSNLLLTTTVRLS